MQKGAMQVAFFMHGSLYLSCLGRKMDQDLCDISIKSSPLKYLISQQCCDSENKSGNTRVKNTVTIV